VPPIQGTVNRNLRLHDRKDHDRDPSQPRTPALQPQGQLTATKASSEDLARPATCPGHPYWFSLSGPGSIKNSRDPTQPLMIMFSIVRQGG